MPEMMSYEEILNRLKSSGNKYLYPRAGQRDFWDNIPDEQKTKLIAQGEEALRTYSKPFRFFCLLPSPFQAS